MLSAIAFATLLGSTSAFVGSTSRTVGRSMALNEKSQALPFEKRPPNLDPTLAGDAGFDPFGFTNVPPVVFWKIPESGKEKWYREAEIVHGRVAQLAVVGNIFPYYAHWSGNPEIGVPADAFAELNPYKALGAIPEWGLAQLILGIFAVEYWRIKNVICGDRPAGDLNLGQKGRFNPFNFDYTEEEYAEKELQEIKHGRLAMFGALGMLLQASKSGLGITEQLAQSLSWPDERAILNGPGTLGDYFPSGL